VTKIAFIAELINLVRWLFNKLSKHEGYLIQVQEKTITQKFPRQDRNKPSQTRKPPCHQQSS
jgi:hypothetical protein